MAYENYTLDYLIEEENRCRDLYYSTKRLTNHTTDITSICKIWDQASSYWDEANEMRKEIEKRKSKENL
jgi:hypothetical protein